MRLSKTLSKNRIGKFLKTIQSTFKKDQDRKRREHRLEKVFKELGELEERLNKYYLKTQKQIEKTVDEICGGSRSLVNIDIIEEKN